MRIWWVACFVSILAVAAMSDDLPQGVVVGGSISVDGRLLTDHPYLRQHGHDYFPISVLSMALHYRVRYDLTGTQMTCNGHLFKLSDVLKINELIYVTWADVHRMMPAVSLKAGHDRVAFDSGTQVVRSTPDPTPSPPASTGGDLVAVHGIQPRLDQNGRVLVDAVLHNNSDQAFDNVVATLVLTDASAATGNKVYARYEQPVGTLSAQSERSVTFETDISNPVEIDASGYRLKIELAGLSLQPTVVTLTYRIDVDRKP